MGLIRLLQMEHYDDGEVWKVQLVNITIESCGAVCVDRKLEVWWEGLNPCDEFAGEVGGKGRVDIRGRASEVLGYPANDGTKTDPIDEDLSTDACVVIDQSVGKVVESGFRDVAVSFVDDRWLPLTDGSKTFASKRCPPDTPANEMGTVVCRMIVLRRGRTRAERGLMVDAELLAVSDYTAGPPPGRVTVKNRWRARAPPVEERDGLQ
jgi:hypothetical protein